MPRLVTVVALSAVLAGCSVRATVHVTMRRDGSGTVRAQVTLDADAVQAAEAGGTNLAQRVRLTDLRQAGWTVTPWVPTRAGGATLTVTKPFSSPDQVTSIIRELSGTTGPLRAVRATRDAAWIGLGHRVAVHGVVDLAAAQPGLTTDPALVTSLTGQHVDVNAINTQLLAQLRTAFSVRLVVDLPGAHRAVTAPPGKTVALYAAATTIDTVRVALLAVAVALAALATVVWWRRGRRGRRGGRRDVIVADG